jgi:hypothetical protein
MMDAAGPVSHVRSSVKRSDHENLEKGEGDNVGQGSR